MPSPDDLISPAYLEEQRRLHADPRGYGTKGRKWLTQVQELAGTFGAHSILDYGCGQASLMREFWANPDPLLVGVDFRSWDPAVPQWGAWPEPADLVVCTDVLEHVEADKMEAVLDHLQSLAHIGLFVVVSLVPTAKVLSDGRQAHISLHPKAWWEEQLGDRFDFLAEYEVSPEKQWVAAFLKKGSL